MIAHPTRRALAGVVLLLAALMLAMPDAVGSKRVQPFCVGVRNTWVEACVGSFYDTIAALVALIGMGMPF